MKRGNRVNPLRRRRLQGRRRFRSRARGDFHSVQLPVLLPVLNLESGKAPKVSRFFAIMVDKSVLQGLAPREADWLFHHYRVMIPPVFFAELIGDLHKGEKKTSTGSGEGDAKMLAGKVNSALIDLNAHSEKLIEMELRGNRFPLRGVPVTDRAERIVMEDGKAISFIDKAPMQAVMDRWQEGKFDEMEKEFARDWRERIEAIDLEALVRGSKDIRMKDIKMPTHVMSLVCGLLHKKGQDRDNLTKWMEVLGVPPAASSDVLKRWEAEGKPLAQSFAPYTGYAATHALYFHVAVAHGVVTTRKSNKIDLDYLLYLPFTKVFSSSDKLHSESFPVFAQRDQIFISGPDLKSALKDFADFYEKLEDGSGSDYPPTDMDNAITRSYDSLMPKWRERAKAPKVQRTPELDAKILELLNPKIEAIKAFLAKK